MGHNSIPNIFVTVNPLEPQQSIPSWSAHAIDRIETHYSYISPRRQYWHEAVIQDEFEELDGMTSLSCSSSTSTTTTTTDESTKVYEPSEGRQYFHSRTGAVVLEHEKNYDSDDDVDEEWINELGERLLDEFEDVSLEEKEFMKRWNRYTRANPILADFMVASNCRQFAKQYGKELIECGLRNNFLLHLFNLWDNSLLTNKAVLECMLIADHMASTLPKDE
jgi:hypothetical protein